MHFLLRLVLLSGSVLASPRIWDSKDSIDLETEMEAMSANPTVTTSPGMDPETVPELFQGDIAIDEAMFNHLRIGINPVKYPQRLWDNRTIPFVISDTYGTDERAFLERTLRTMSALTCVKFVPFGGQQKDYIHIKPPVKAPKGCWSYVGRTGGAQVVSLQMPDANSRHCFSSEGRVMHELMHAIGIYHEQSRPDRDKFVKIHWENILPKYKKNFKLVSEKRGKATFEYDYNSVMHYGLFYFSKEKGKKPTVTPLKENIRIGQRETMSKIDCLKINDLYGCLKGREARKYRSFCTLLGK